MHVVAAFLLRLAAEAAIELRAPGPPLWPHFAADALRCAADAYDRD